MLPIRPVAHGEYKLYALAALLNQCKDLCVDLAWILGPLLNYKSAVTTKGVLKFSGDLFPPLFICGRSRDSRHHAISGKSDAAYCAERQTEIVLQWRLRNRPLAEYTVKVDQQRVIVNGIPSAA